MEIESILKGTGGLLYQNAIETVEFSRPSILTNGTVLLYILALPKIADTRNRLMHLCPTVHNGGQVVLDHKKLAMDASKT